MRNVRSSTLAVCCWLLAAGCWSAEPLVLNGDFLKPRTDAADQPLGWGKVDGLGVSWRDAQPQSDELRGGHDSLLSIRIRRS